MAKEFDIVRLQDGREGTVLETFKDGEAFLLEIADKEGKTIDTPIVEAKDISRIIYNA